MDYSKLYHIIDGRIRVKPYWYTFCPPHMRVAAELYYKKCLKEFLDEGLYNEDDYNIFLVNNGFWSSAEQKQLEQSQKDLESLKLEAYKTSLTSLISAKAIKETISSKKEEILNLYCKKHAFEHLSAKGLATIQKNKFIVASSLIFKKKRLVGSISQYHLLCSKELEDTINKIRDISCNETEIRYFARCEEWRSYWNTRKSGFDIFGKPSVKLTDEQRNLILWSSLYDNIYENPDCPPQFVIEDDDYLDGWMINQKKNKETEQKKTEFTSNKKIKEAREVFIPVKKDEEGRIYTQHAKELESLNDDEARNIKISRLKQIQERGEVAHHDFKDVRREVKQKAMEMKR